jgi:rubrerythrin
MGEVMKMKLTQKESMLLQDLKTSEEICIEKYGQYAQKAEDPALADLFLTIRTKEEEHLKTIRSLMDGTVPMMSGGQQSQQSGQSCQPGDGKAAEKSHSKTDEYLLKDALDTEKHVSSVYDTCIFEFTDAGARSALNHIQKEEQEHGQMLYDYMSTHGMTA